SSSARSAAPSASMSKMTVPTPWLTRRRTVAPPSPPAPPVTMADRPWSSIAAFLPLGRAQAVGNGGVGVSVAAGGGGAVVHLACRLVVDAAGELRLHRMGRRARPVLGLDPGLEGRRLQRRCLRLLASLRFRRRRERLRRPGQLTRAGSFGEHAPDRVHGTG